MWVSSGGVLFAPKTWHSIFQVVVVVSAFEKYKIKQNKASILNSVMWDRVALFSEI